MAGRAPREEVWGWTGPVRVVAALAALAVLVALVLTAPPAAPAHRAIPGLRVDPNTAPEAVLLALPAWAGRASRRSSRRGGMGRSARPTS